MIYTTVRLMRCAFHTALAAISIGTLMGCKDVNTRDKEGLTRLHHLALDSESSLQEMEKVLAAGADVDARDSNGQTPLHWAADNPAFDFAPEEAAHDLQAIRLLIRANADVNSRDNRGRTPLMQAAEAGRADMIAALLDAGARITDVDTLKNSALHYAVESNFKTDEAVELLAERGAPLTGLNAKSLTPAHLAATRCDDHTLRVLHRHGVSFDRSLAELAAGKGCEHTVALLADLVEGIDGAELLAANYRKPIVYVLDSGFSGGDRLSHGTIVLSLVKRHFYGRVDTVELASSHADVSGRGLLEGLTRIHDYAERYPLSPIIVNLSWGSVERDPLVEAMIRSLRARKVVVVAAVGNDGEDTCPYPAAYPGVIAVASVVEKRDGSMEAAPYSNRGTCVSAAAVDDVFALARDLERQGVLHRSEPEAYKEVATQAGTSLAAPVVAGAIADYLDDHPDTAFSYGILKRLAVRNVYVGGNLVPVIR